MISIHVACTQFLFTSVYFGEKTILLLGKKCCIAIMYADCVRNTEKLRQSDGLCKTIVETDKSIDRPGRAGFRHSASDIFSSYSLF